MLAIQLPLAQCTPTICRRQIQEILARLREGLKAYLGMKSCANHLINYKGSDSKSIAGCMAVLRCSLGERND
jgi:hypothetical protein